MAESYFFNGCKISNAVIGNYVINIEKNIIEVELKGTDGAIQNFSDKIQSIEANKIISERIKSRKGDKLYYQYFLNSNSKTVIKLEYIEQSGIDMSVFKLKSKRTTYCNDVRADWNKAKIEKKKAKLEQKEILKAQKELKKEQESIFICKGDDFKQWTDCKGSYKTADGHKYTGVFKGGKIIKGISLYLEGAKYVGEFKNLVPNGYGTFVWANGDKYYGAWKNGKTHGNGTKIWQNGRKYLGEFKDDKLHGQGTLFYSDGKKYEGGFVNGKRHGKGTFVYADGAAYIGNFIAGQEQGIGECVDVDGISKKCTDKNDTQAKDFSGKDIRSIQIIAKKWVRISQYEANSKKGKKIMDKLKLDFASRVETICLPKTNYNVLDKKIDIMEVDETPAYGLETKLKLAINGVVECK